MSRKLVLFVLAACALLAAFGSSPLEADCWDRCRFSLMINCDLELVDGGICIFGPECDRLSCDEWTADCATYCDNFFSIWCSGCRIA